MARRRRSQPSPMYNPDTDFVTNVAPQGESSAENFQKHIKYLYWIQFITLILLTFVVLYAYLKGIPVKVR